MTAELDRRADDGGSYEEEWEMDLSELYNDGDVIELEGGRKLRLKIEPDEMYQPFEETDTYGRIGWDGWSNDYGYPTRPAGFDGNAERIPILNDMVWWQPPGDVKRSDPEFARLRSLVGDLASFGCSMVTLEILKDSDAYGRSIVRQVASLGGIDSLDNGYQAEVIRDLAAELNLT